MTDSKISIDRAPSKGGKKRMNISAPFVFALVIMFTATIICTLISGVLIYKNINEKMNERYGETTPLLYLSSKIRSHDYVEDGIDGVFFDTIDGCPALALYEGYECATYIYHCDGKIYELFMSIGAGLAATDGEVVAECKDLTFIADGNLITVAMTASDGEVKQVSVMLNSLRNIGG